MIGPLTGRKVAIIGGTLFALVFAPNIILAVYAVQTFSGLVVPNSYVASQEFDARRRAQEALAWSLSLDALPGELRLAITDAVGDVVRPPSLAVTVGRPTTTAQDRELALVATPAGSVAPLNLAPGAWVALVEATADNGTPFSQRHSFTIRPPS
jgi:nitrogen fixation protein FixH